MAESNEGKEEKGETFTIIVRADTIDGALAPMFPLLRQIYDDPVESQAENAFRDPDNVGPKTVSTNGKYVIRAYRHNVVGGNIEQNDDGNGVIYIYEVKFEETRNPDGERLVSQDPPRYGDALYRPYYDTSRGEQKAAHMNISLQTIEDDDIAEGSYIKVTDRDGNGYAYRILTIHESPGWAKAGGGKSLYKKKRTKKRTKRRSKKSKKSKKRKKKTRRKSKHRKKSQNRKNRKKK